MGKFIDVTLRLVDKMTAPLTNAGKALANHASQFQKAGKQIQNAGKAIGNVGSSMTKGITVPIVAAGTACIKLAADFEQGMSKVHATMGDLEKTSDKSMKEMIKTAGELELKVDTSLSKSEQQMDLLSQMAEKMGRKTKYSAAEATEAYNYMAMAGWKASDMLNGIKPVMELAGASGEDLALTSDILTDSLTAFGKTAKDTEHFANVMAAASSNANTNVAMLGESFKYCAPVAGTWKYSIDDTAVALGLMANSGIKASNAGTALRTLFTNMANPTDTMATAMKTLGVSLDDGKGNMKSLSQVMNDLRNGFGNLKMPQQEYNKQLNDLNAKLGSGELSTKKYNKEAEKLVTRAYGAEGALKAQAAAQLAGKTGMAGLLAIVNSSDKDFNKLTKAVKESDGACHDMYETANDNLLGKLTELKSILEGVGKTIGDKFIQPATDLVEWVGIMADKFHRLSDEQQNTIIKIALVAASIGPAILIFGKVVGVIGSVVSAVGKVGKAFKTFGSLAGIIASPAGIVILTVAGIAAAAILLWKNWDKIKPKMQAAIGAVAKIFKDLKPKIDPVIKTVTKTIDSMKKTVEKSMPAIQKATNKAFKAIQPYIKMAGEFLKEVADIIKNVLSKAFDSVKPVIEKFGDAFNAVFPKISGLIEIFAGILSFLAPVAQTVFFIAAEKIDTFGKKVSEIFDSVCQIFGGVLDFITGVFTGNWEKAWNGVKDIFSGIFKTFVAIAKAPINGVIGVINGAIRGLNKVKVPDWVPGAGGKGINIPLIPKLAKGTNNWKGGIVQISERGGEIVDLPQGSRVYPHDKSVKKAYQDGANSKSKGRVVISIPKLADKIIIREDADIDKLVDKMMNKLEKVVLNIGGEDIGYLY